MAVSMWGPSSKGIVFQRAVALTEGAGAGERVVVSGWVPTPKARLATWLPSSVACAWTVTVPRTKPFCGDPWNETAGARSSWVRVASAGGLVRPSPARGVAEASKLFEALGMSGPASEKAPAASANPVTAVAASLTTRSTRAPGSVVPLTGKGDWFAKAGTGDRK